MEAHRSSSVVGFPNLFLILGPNAGLGHTSVVYMAEAQAHYALQVLRHLDERGPTPSSRAPTPSAPGRTTCSAAASTRCG